DELISAVAKGRRFLSKSGPRFSDMANWAESEVPGPVHLDIAGSAIENDAPVPVSRDDVGAASSNQQVLDFIRNAQRPVVIAGTLSIRKRLSSYLNGLSIPVFSVAAAKGVIDETLPHSAGVYTGVGLELTPEYSVLAEADLVLGIGLRHNEILGVKAFPCKSVNLDTQGHRLCNGFHFDHVFEGASEEMDVLFSALSQRTWGLESLRQCQKKLREKMLAGDFMPANAFRVIERHFQHHARLVLDTGNFCTIGEHIWRVPKPGLYVASGQGRYMGAGLPMALGAAIYDPGVPTVVFLGDGGIGMFLADMKLAVQHRLPLIVVLMSDAYLGSIRVQSIKDDLTEKPVTIHQPSWLKAVEGLGVEAHRAGSEQAVEDILNSWDFSKGPIFIELHFDPEAYQHMVGNIR
ncbi:MAG: thiamine pyrophosphate-binding protein, partial [Deltaproteobacteria bacterium]|nr:thiamine pyrophosphate-binding protein [Deltaproteobacteria bacterium]